ncbi:MAG: tetratricopeptide repeat protein [Pirellulaceae bacterium]
MKSASKTILLLALAITGLYSCGRILIAPWSQSVGETAWHSPRLEPSRILDDRTDRSWKPIPGESRANQGEPAPHVMGEQDEWQSLSVIGTIDESSTGEVRQTALRDSDGFRSVTNPFSESQSSRRAITSLPPVDPDEFSVSVPPVPEPPRTRSLPQIDVVAGNPNPTQSDEMSQSTSRRLNNPFVGDKAMPAPFTGQQEIASQQQQPVQSMNTQQDNSGLSFEPTTRSLPPVGQEMTTALSHNRTSRQMEKPTLPFDQAAALANAMQNAMTESAPQPVQGTETRGVPEIPTLQAEGFASTEPAASTEFTVEQPEMTQPELPVSPSATEPQLTAATEAIGEIKTESDPAALSSQAAQAKPVQQFAEHAASARPTIQVLPIIEQRAMERVAYGKSLARRGATFAARQEFIQALALIADSFDVQSASREYTARLASSLRTLSEADDFVAPDTEQQLNMDMAMILDTHESGLIEPQLANQITPIQAMLTYYAFAQAKMSEAVGQSPAGAEALYALGKLLAANSQLEASSSPVDSVKAMVMYQSALSANPAHYRSANELGVLMARNGQWQKAKDLFVQSLQVQEMPQTWQNLATAHRQLGETRLAELAIAEATKQEGETPAGVGPMEWATPDQFVDNAAMPVETPMAKPVQTAQAVEADTKPEQPRGIFGSMKKLF